MELELGLKLTRELNDFAAADLLIAKDRDGPLFLSGETETMFILTAHLKGYKRENIKIDIIEGGTIITIGGEKLVPEMVVVGGKVLKKEEVMRGFRKAFTIPGVVILDKIKANLNEDELLLTITMPKSVKGVTRIQIVEVKEDMLAWGFSGSLDFIGDKVTEKEKMKQDEYGEPEIVDVKQTDQAKQKLPEEYERREGYENLSPGKEEPAGSKVMHQEETQGEEANNSKERAKKKKEVESQLRGKELEEEKTSQGVRAPEEFKGDQQLHQAEDQDQHKENKIVRGKEIDGRENDTHEEVNGAKKTEEGESSRAEKEYPRDQSTQTGETPTKRFKICAPMFAGSALLVSLIVFVIHVFRDKSQQSKKQ
ncbi:unnamed protein product [Ilex paraguariensis]|uniref:SHSP domain-containing protein n=1 Tax=Ilex paraguariensis TaxID=185542 RepID=A0ABC8QWK5_9AQUA